VNKFKIIPADNFIWNQQALLEFLVANQGKDIVIDTNEEGCCAEKIGLYKFLNLFDFKSVTINTNNILEKHNVYKVTGDKFFKFFNVGIVDYHEYHKWNQKKVFGAFYNRALWHRIGLAGHLLNRHENTSLINFRSNPHNEDARRLFEMQKLFEFDTNSSATFLKLMNKLPIQLELIDGYTVGATTKQHTDQLCKFYSNILIDIVAETFVAGNTFFVTEKTVRPILMKKPFIIMGSKNFMIYLRQMGFKTFYEYWDEEYDGFETKDRYLKILTLIDNIASKSIEELFLMYKSMQDILEYNYNLLVTKQFIKDIKYVE